MTMLHQNDDLQIRHNMLADRIEACTKCKGMNKKGRTQASPGFTPLNPGQSPTKG